MTVYRIEYAETGVWRVDIEGVDEAAALDNFWDRLGDLGEASEVGIEDTTIRAIKEVR